MVSVTGSDEFAVQYDQFHPNINEKILIIGEVIFNWLVYFYTKTDLKSGENEPLARNANLPVGGRLT